MAIRSDIDRVLSDLAQRSGIPRRQLNERFHRIKRRGRASGPRDSNFIDDTNGSVYDEDGAAQDAYVGNVFNDF